MYSGYRVVAVTPAGREKYLEILAPYLIKCDLIDEWRLWVNTTNSSDIEYMRSLSLNNQKVTLEYNKPEFPIGIMPLGYTIHQFYRNCCDPKTIYIRFDDDICWINITSIDNLLFCRLNNNNNFLVFANIINNAITSHLYQRFGYIRYNKIITYLCMDSIGWGCPEFGEWVHRTFLANGWPHMPDWELNIYERFSVNCFAFFGRDFAQFAGHVGQDEEVWLSVVKPHELQRPNLICGTAPMAHFAFYTQRDYLERTELLDIYKQKSLHV
jgi:hypothetical protein